jgi:hypothetical protein
MSSIERRTMAADGRREGDVFNKRWCEERGEFCKALHEGTKKSLNDKIDAVDGKVDKIDNRVSRVDARMWALLIMGLTSMIGIFGGILLFILKPMIVEAIQKNIASTFVETLCYIFAIA